jgi:molybdopterin-guanine dinucleotide biosynthesis protein A
MGADKLALRFGDESLLERCVRLVRQVASEVVLVAREGQKLPAALEALRDPAEGLGPLAGMAAGLAAISAERALVVAGDMPLLRPALLERLLELSEGFDACLPVIGGYPVPTCAVYKTTLAARARELVEARRLRPSALLEGARVRLVEPRQLSDLDPELESFLDCDTPEEYAAAVRQASRASPSLRRARRG